MYTKIYENSYVIFIITFIILIIIFYIFKIGYSITIVDNKIEQKFNWKYPLAISLIVWVVWQFFLYPPKNDKIIEYEPKHISTQKINLDNWN